MRTSIRKCPKCQDAMFISEISCPSCDTTIRGEFPIEDNGDESKSMLDRLSEDDKYFVLVFLQTGGKIQDVERVMGISYPTVKSRLNEIQHKLKGESYHWDRDDDDDEIDDDDDGDIIGHELKHELKQMKRNLKKHIRAKVRADLRHGMGTMSVHIPKPSHRHGVHIDPDIDIDIDSGSDPGITEDMTDTGIDQRETDMKERKKRVAEILDGIESGEMNIDDALDKLKDKD